MWGMDRQYARNFTNIIVRKTYKVLGIGKRLIIEYGVQELQFLIFEVNGGVDQISCIE